MTIPLALVILFIVGFENQLGGGPFWDAIENTQVQNCKQHWWALLLYINNFVGLDGQCMSQSWYLSVDFQLFAYSPLLLYPMFKSKSSKCKLQTAVRVR